MNDTTRNDIAAVKMRAHNGDLQIRELHRRMIERERKIERLQLIVMMLIAVLAAAAFSAAG